jgi:hypothetical protein
MAQVSRKMSIMKEMAAYIEEGLCLLGYWRVPASYVRERKVLWF